MGPFKITVYFELHADGGLRAYSDGVPGLALSSMDVDVVLADVIKEVSLILSRRLNAQVYVEPLTDIREVLEDKGHRKATRIHPRTA